MVPTKKDDLRKMVTQTTIETYEELTPQLIRLIESMRKQVGKKGEGEGK